MVSFPNCKINLGLSIINKRTDGYHNLETVFYPLPVRDVLEVITDPTSELTTLNQGLGHAIFSTSGLVIDGYDNNNLCLKAWHLLAKDFPALPSVKMHLHKAIPMGAGLGGGSADGAFVLNLINSMFKLELSIGELISYAVQLGSDCPFFIINKPCFASGRGEIMEPLAVDLSRFHFVLVNPGISINTGWAFSQLKVAGNLSLKGTTGFKEILNQPVSDWKNVLFNDFENPVFEKFPEIRLVKEQLYENGALFASMSGSGSTVFGIFEDEVARELYFPAHYLVLRVRG